MSYKSILTAISDPRYLNVTLDHACTLANSEDGHVDVVALGLDRSQTGFYYAGVNAMMLQEMLNHAIAEADAIEKDCETKLAKSGVRWNVDTVVTAIPDLTRHIATPSRFNDLVVLPLPYGPECGTELAAIVEAALFEGRAPVLAVPHDAAPNPSPKRIAIAWNQSAEALAAIRAALPFLRRALDVHVVVVDPPMHGPDRSDPGGPLSQMLSRHGVNCQIDVLGRSVPRISDVLNRHAIDIEADMIVMGAYGHSRMREAILGGATRNMLEQAKVPVFLTH